jgi:hypothetical protein
MSVSTHHVLMCAKRENCEAVAVELGTAVPYQVRANPGVHVFLRVLHWRNSGTWRDHLTTIALHITACQ